jgi:hypothetical protein
MAMEISRAACLRYDGQLQPFSGLDLPGLCREGCWRKIPITLKIPPKQAHVPFS